VRPSPAERYLRLGLQLGRHSEGIVDAWPRGLKGMLWDPPRQPFPASSGGRQAMSSSTMPSNGWSASQSASTGVSPVPMLGPSGASRGEPAALDSGEAGVDVELGAG
jgi:hypothetical protein